MSQETTETNLPQLTALTIEPGKIDFSPDIYEYHIQLDEGTSKMLVMAKAPETASYKVNNNSNLQSGMNTITVEVNDSGKKAVYTIYAAVGEIEEASESAYTQVSTPVQDGAGISGWFVGGGIIVLVLGLLIALLTWRRIRIRKEQQRIREKKRLERQKRAEQSKRQEEELLALINNLSKKKVSVNEKGLRVVELDYDSMEPVTDDDESEFDDSIGYDTAYESDEVNTEDDYFDDDDYEDDDYDYEDDEEE